MKRFLMLRIVVAFAAFAGCAADLQGSELASAEESVEQNKQAGGFTHSCSDFHIQHGSQLVASCANEKGHREWTWLDLNYGVANDNGYLVWRPYGGFAGSCWSCDMPRWKDEPDGDMRCTCRRADGSDMIWYIDLDEQISNHNGVLAFDFPL